MMDGWDKMSAVERQDAFLARWASGEGLEFASEQAKADYQYRTGLLAGAFQISDKVDRVAIAPLVTFAPTMMGGLSGKKAMYDGEATGKAYLDFVNKFQPDAAGAAPMIMCGQTLEALDYKLYKWPGHGVAEDLYYQFMEKEYMKPAEYDQLIADPTDFWLRTWLPRTCGALEPLASMAPIYATMELPMSSNWLIPLGTPPVQAALKALMEAGRITFEWINKLGPYLAKIMGAGYPFYAGGATKAPFDTLSDSLRGTTPLMMDLFRRPDKVLEAVQRLTKPMIDCGVGGAMANNNPIVFIPLHKGADGFMSDEQFKKFYWPTLNALMHGLAEQGCVPACFVEGGYNQRLEYLADTYDIRCMYLFDRTDMAQAHKVLGGKVCIAGGFPVSLMLTGTPEQVREETKKLLDKAAGSRGYILSVGCAMDEGRADTFQALIETGKELGKY